MYRRRRRRRCSRFVLNKHRINVDTLASKPFGSFANTYEILCQFVHAVVVVASRRDGLLPSSEMQLQSCLWLGFIILSRIRVVIVKKWHRRNIWNALQHVSLSLLLVVIKFQSTFSLALISYWVSSYSDGKPGGSTSSSSTSCMFLLIKIQSVLCFITKTVTRATFYYAMKSLVYNLGLQDEKSRSTDYHARAQT